MPRPVPLLLAVLAVLLAAVPVCAGGKAESSLQALRARAADPSGDREKLRQELLAFRRAHTGTPEAVEAAELLAGLPSPLDRLDPAAIPTLDRFDWQPKELVAVLGEHRGRHGSPVSCVAYSPDGKSIVSGGSSWLRLWDPATLRQRTILGSGGSITAVVYARDGKTLASTGSDAVVRLWDVSGDKPKTGPVIPAGTAVLYALAISPSGKLVAAAGQDTIVRVFDISGAKPQEKAALTGHTGLVYALAFSPDGKTLASASADSTVRLWDTNADPPKEGPVLEGHEKEVTCLAFAPQLKPITLASGSTDGSLRLWDLSQARPQTRAAIKASTAALDALAYTASGRTLASAGSDATVKLWDATVKEPKEKAVLEGHAGAIASVAFAPDGLNLATGSSDWTVRLWGLNQAKPKQRWEPKAHLSKPYAVVFAPDGQGLASGSEDRTVRLWTLAGRDGKERSLLRADGQVYALAMAPDGKMLAVGGNSITVRLWDPALGRSLHRLQDAPGAVGSLAFTPDGHQVLGTSGKVVCVWDAAGGKEVRRLQGPTTNVGAVAVSPDGRRALAGSGDYLYKDGRIVYKDNQPVWTDCALRGWDLESGDEVFCLKDFARQVACAAFTPDGKTALSGDGESRLRFWDVGGDTPKPGGVFRGASGYVFSAMVAPDGKSVTTYGQDGKLIVWELPSGKRLHEWASPEYLGGVAYAPDSRHLAVGVGTGPVYVLRLAEPQKSSDTSPKR
jgi:WD40 repeat protein